MNFFYFLGEVLIAYFSKWLLLLLADIIYDQLKENKFEKSMLRMLVDIVRSYISIKAECIVTVH